MIDDLIDEPSYDEGPEDDSQEPESREKCHCPFCECLALTKYAICDDCLRGAHQG